MQTFTQTNKMSTALLNDGLLISATFEEEKDGEKFIHSCKNKNECSSF